MNKEKIERLETKLISLRNNGATLKHFNGASWYMDYNNTVIVIDTALGTYETMDKKQSKKYLKQNTQVLDFDEKLSSYFPNSFNTRVGA